MKVFISLKLSNHCEEQRLECFTERVDGGDAFENQYDQYKTENGWIPQSQNGCSSPIFGAEFYLLGAALQLRGLNPIVQPLMDVSRNILVYNGKLHAEIYRLKFDI